jgi:hypothetical protein
MDGGGGGRQRKLDRTNDWTKKKKCLVVDCLYSRHPILSVRSKKDSLDGFIFYFYDHLSTTAAAAATDASRPSFHYVVVVVVVL